MRTVQTILLLMEFLVIVCSTNDIFPCKSKKAVLIGWLEENGIQIFENSPLEGQCPIESAQMSSVEIAFMVNGSEPTKISDYLAKDDIVVLTEKTAAFVLLRKMANNILITQTDKRDTSICQVYGHTTSEPIVHYTNQSLLYPQVSLDSKVTSLPVIKSLSCRGCAAFENCSTVIEASFEKNRSSAALLSAYANPDRDDEVFYGGFKVGLPFREGSQNMRSHLERFLANPWAEVEQAYTFKQRAEKTLKESRHLFDIWSQCAAVSVCDRPVYC